MTADKPEATRRRRARVSPVPWWLALLACLAAVYLVLPIVLMGVRVPWGEFGTILAEEETVEAMKLSLRTCLVAVVIDLILGVPLALVLSRKWTGVRLARVVVALPLALPPVVAGIALLSAFGRQGLIGAQLEAAGITVAFTTVAVVMAQVFVSLPFLVITLESALRTRPAGLEETAAALGAKPSTILWRVTLPMVIPGIARGAALAAARCLGEFGATITFAGTLQSVTRTMPSQIYLTREADPDSALALGMVLVLAALAVVAITELPGLRRPRHANEEEADSPEASGSEVGDEKGNREKGNCEENRQGDRGEGVGASEGGGERACESLAGKGVAVSGESSDSGRASHASRNPTPGADGLVLSADRRPIGLEGLPLGSQVHPSGTEGTQPGAGGVGSGASGVPLGAQGNGAGSRGATSDSGRVVLDPHKATPSGEASAPGLPEPAGPPSGPVGFAVDGTVAERSWAVRLDVPAGQVLAVMGHNGAGKSTLAELLAGRLALSTGELRIGERMVDGPGAFVPARRRRIGIVSQDPRIFPRMSVLANVAFPLRCRGYSRSQAARAAAEQLRAVGCGHLASRRGDQLSGGQAARVALARALVLRPDLLVLDEPTSALDVRASARVSRILADRLRQDATTTVLVTHDVAEALQLASHIAVMDSGRIVEQGPATQVLTKPSSPFGASLAGLNVVAGKLVFSPEGLPGVQVGKTFLVAAGQPEGSSEGEDVALIFAPESVAVYRNAPAGSPRSMLAGRVETADISRGLATLGIQLAGGATITARVTAVAWAELGLGVGENVVCAVKATQVRMVRSGREVRPTA